jgi:hypothetical protein
MDGEDRETIDGQLPNTGPHDRARYPARCARAEEPIAAVKVIFIEVQLVE